MSDLEASQQPCKKSHRPKNTRFYQQRLKAWQPIVTARNVFPFFFAVAAIFVPIGIILIVTSNNISERIIEYTHCVRNDQNVRCSEEVRRPEIFGSYKFCPCTVNFTLDVAMPGPVYLYYGLSNFYQNHRRYVISRDDNQLHGDDIQTPSAECEPYRYTTDEKMVAPCGAIAMSLFNDTFTLKFWGPSDGQFSTSIDVPMTSQGIAWRTDVEKKFGKPPASMWSRTGKPLSWPKTALQRSPDAYSGDEELIVWMRPAALPTFRKLHRRILHQNQFSDGLPAGIYQSDIGYAYPVTQFGGSKRLILSTASWFGGRNPTLGIAYIVVGCVHCLLGIVFVVVHVILNRNAPSPTESSISSTTVA